VSDDIRELWPDPPETLTDRLQHFVDSWPSVPDSTVVVMATSGVYGVGVMTGLTMGDIRTLAGDLAMGPETVAYGERAERLGRQLRAQLARDDLGRFQRRERDNGSASDQGGPAESHRRP
jgi:hypothetical protein